jgi:hypothetical protein
MQLGLGICTSHPLPKQANKKPRGAPPPPRPWFVWRIYCVFWCTSKDVLPLGSWINFICQALVGRGGGRGAYIGTSTKKKKRPGAARSKPGFKTRADTWLPLWPSPLGGGETSAPRGAYGRGGGGGLYLTGHLRCRATPHAYGRGI